MKPLKFNSVICFRLLLGMAVSLALFPSARGDSIGHRLLVLTNNFNITRMNSIHVEPAVDPVNGTQTILQFLKFDYVISDDTGLTSKMTLLESDCDTESPITNEVLPITFTEELVEMAVFGQDAALCTNATVTYDPFKVENSTIWIPEYNDNRVETGGTFAFCSRVDLIDVLSNHSVNFMETIYNVTVDKTSSAGFNLGVSVKRDEAVEEEITGVDYSADIRGFPCDISTFQEQENVTFSQGSLLGLCVESQTAGISVVGWDSLLLERDTISFKAIDDGQAISNNLVVTGERNEGVTSNVLLISSFFGSDGSVAVSGSVVVDLSDRRRLGARSLEENSGTGSFDLDIELESTTSVASSLFPSCASFGLFALVIMFAL